MLLAKMKLKQGLKQLGLYVKKMYKMKIYISFLIILLLLAFGCNSTKLIVKKRTNKVKVPQDTINYMTYWTAMRCGLPELAYNYNPNKEELEFAKGLNYLERGLLEESENIYEKLFLVSKNKLIRANSQFILSQLFIYQAKWSKYYNLLRDKAKPDSIEKKRLFYPAFLGIKTKKYFSTTIDTIPIKLYKGLILVPVILNGKNYHFLFDTGVQLTTLSSDLANNNGVKILLNQSESMLGSTGKLSDGFSAIINKLKIGNFSLFNKPCIITSSSNLNLKFLFISYIDLDGIIGWDIIKNLDVEINYQKKLMIIRKPVKQNIKNRNLIWLSDPIVKLKSKDGANLLFFLDLGAQSSCYYDFLQQKLELKDLHNSNIINFGIGGSFLKNVKSIPKITFILNNMNLNFSNLKQGTVAKEEFLILDGCLGNDILKNNILRIDASNGIFQLFKK